MRLNLLSILLATLLPVAAFAHSPLSLVIPPDGAIISVAPKQIALEFKHAVRLTSVKLESPGDRAQKLQTSKSATLTHQLPLGKLERGKHTVKWRALSSDGHPMKGTFSFTIE